MKVAGVVISILAAFFGIWTAIDFVNNERSREHAADQMSLHAFEKSPDYEKAALEDAEAEKSERTDAIMGGAAVVLLGAGFAMFEASIKSSLKRGPL